MVKYLRDTRVVCIALVLAIGGFQFPQNARGQGTPSTSAPKDDAPVRSVEERVTIQPYTGPPIYLDEAKEVAPPTIVNRQTRTDKYEDGTVWMERQLARFSDDHYEADGFYKEYYPSGKPFVEGTFQRGRQHGEWTYWYDNGQINRKATYNNGQPDGDWEVYRADGTLIGKRGFRDGKRHGDWLTYDSSGKKPVREEHYDNGKAEGVWKIWDANGQLRKQISFKQGMFHGPTIEWTDKGVKRSEINYADNKLDGTATIWAPDGRQIVQEYKAGRLVSESKQ